MTRLLFVPNPHTLLWLDALDPPAELADAVLRGEWRPPAPFPQPNGKLVAYWQEDLVIITALPLQTGPADNQPTLNRRQREILKGLIDGLTTRQMALRLGVQPRTIYHQLADLKRKFQVASRTELALKARDVLRGSRSL